MFLLIVIPQTRLAVVGGMIEIVDDSVRILI